MVINTIIYLLTLDSRARIVRNDQIDYLVYETALVVTEKHANEHAFSPCLRYSSVNMLLNN
jgi:hypothetical protein